jgi:hypothetical protein
MAVGVFFQLLDSAVVSVVRAIYGAHLRVSFTPDRCDSNLLHSNFISIVRQISYGLLNFLCSTDCTRSV